MLAIAQDTARSAEFAENALLPTFKWLVVSYKRLLSFAKKAVRIADLQGKALKDREYRLQGLLDNCNQGFFTFGADLLVEEGYSAECERIFGRKIQREFVYVLLTNNTGAKSLYDNEIRLYMEVFATVLQTKVETPFSQLPANIVINDRQIDVKYRLIDRRQDDPVILVTLTDVTERIASEAQVRYLSEHDSLTTLFNRGYVDKALAQLLTDDHLPLSIILADMNALKLTNDVFGHHKGDELILRITRILKNCCRPGDIAARWGGDEFLILLPNTTHEACQAIAEEIHQACRAADADFVHVSVAIGTATTERLDINTADLFALAENRMYKNKLAEAGVVRKSIVEKVEYVLESRGFVAPGHAKRLQYLVDEFAKHMGATNSVDISALRLMASLHDAGKVALPADMLTKPGPLTTDEWKAVHTYTELGYRMAQSIGEPIAAEAILALREHWDGSGYPKGLAGKQIPRLARLFAILECFELMTAGTHYHSAVSGDTAVEQIRAAAGKQFDPEIVQLFIERYQVAAANGLHVP